MKTTLYMAIATIMLTSCNKAYITYDKAYIKNRTNHHIEIIPCHSGTIDTSKILYFEAGDSLKVADSFQRNIVNHSGFNWSLIDGMGMNDSVIVIFDSLFRIAHYSNDPAKLYPKHYLINSDRNIINYLSWEYSYEDVSKYERRSFYLYVFTEQDYLDAR